jgi:AraC-like DNA-binding protein
VGSAVSKTLIRGEKVAWSMALSRLFVELDVRIGKQHHDAQLRVETRHFGDLELLRTTSRTGCFSVIRSDSLIAHCGSNSFFIACILDGGIALAQAERSIRLATSDLAVLDSTRPYRIDVDGDLDVLWVRVPRHRIEGRIPRLAAVLAQRIDGSLGGGRLTSTLLRVCLEEAERLSETESLRISNALLDLLCQCLNVSTQQGNSRSEQLLRRVQNYIDANIADPVLCRESIARRHGVSPRYLARVFEREGLSVARWIRLRRLELSRQRIEALDPGSSTICEIAYSCGFGDVSSFNRAFKRHFGATPGSLRRAPGRREFSRP